MESIELGMGTQMERFVFFFFPERHKNGVVGKTHFWSQAHLAGIPDLPLTGVWLWANYLISLNLTFHIWKMGP